MGSVTACVTAAGFCPMLSFDFALQYFLRGTLVPLANTGQRKQRKNNVLNERIGQVNYRNLRGTWQPGYSADKVICSDFQSQSLYSKSCTLFVCVVFP